MKRTIASKTQLKKCLECDGCDECLVHGRGNGIDRMRVQLRGARKVLAALRACLAAEAKAKGGGK